MIRTISFSSRFIIDSTFIMLKLQQTMQLVVKRNYKKCHDLILIHTYLMTYIGNISTLCVYIIITKTTYQQRNLK